MPIQLMRIAWVRPRIQTDVFTGSLLCHCVLFQTTVTLPIMLIQLQPIRIMCVRQGFKRILSQARCFVTVFYFRLQWLCLYYLVPIDAYLVSFILNRPQNEKGRWVCFYGETSNLNVKDVDYEEWVIFLRDSKGATHVIFICLRVIG